MAEVSPIELKRTFGRGILRPGKHHQGKRADPTEFAAMSREEDRKKDPTTLEKQLLFLANPKEVRTLKAAGFTDDQIYEMLNR